MLGRGIISFMIFCVSFSLYAQINIKREQRADHELKVHGTFTEKLSIDAAITQFKEKFQMGKGHDFELIKVLKDGSGQHHYRYQHTFLGTKVLGSVLILHTNEFGVNSFNAAIYDTNSSNVTQGKEEAINTALQFIGATKYKWEIESDELQLKEWLKDSTATYYPSPELIYVPKSLNFNNEFALCYKVEVYAEEPLSKHGVYINAVTAEVWAVEELIHIIDVQGIANTKYRGNRTITTDSTAPGNYRLRESGRGGGIETYNMQKGTSYAAAVDFTDADNYWNNYNANFDEIAGDAHFGAEVTYDYFLDKFNRNSFDDNGAKIRSFVHYRNNYANAFWNGLVMTYGDGNGTTVSPLTSLDVCGHEIAHAVTTNSAGLIYSFESGALNESFSDIFGNAIEYYADPSIFNWRIGEDIITSGNGIRNMANPNTHGDPDTYLGTFWHTALSDNGGVHTNSGVQNFWFYLLCEGGTGTNDNTENYSVDSLGMAKAEAIAYRNLTVYLTPSSNYEDARYYGIQSAKDLFGICSHEMITTTNAWHAVGVGDAYDSTVAVADFFADTAYCYASEDVQFYDRSSNARSYLWSFGDGGSDTVQHPMHTYGAQGVYDVQLIVEACYGGVYDTLLQTAYISIDSTRDECNAFIMPYGRWDTVYSCNTVIYDNGGVKDYNNLIKDTLTVVFAPSDSAHLSFEEFAYETDYDSIYIYDGYSTAGTFLGGFTGHALPNGGAPISLYSGAVTIRHFSDNYVVDTGFKARLISYRDSLWYSRTPDTVVCYDQLIDLKVELRGGAVGDHVFYWNGIAGDSILSIRPTSDTAVYLSFGDACLKQFFKDTIYIQVRDPLVVSPISDTTLCYLEDVSFTAEARGGDSHNYNYTWLPSGDTGKVWNTEFLSTQLVSLVVNDGCTPLADTVEFNVTVRDPITFTQSYNDTLCEGGSTSLSMTVSGGLGYYWFKENIYNTTTGSTSPIGILSPSLSPGIHNFNVSITDYCTDTKDTAFFSIFVKDSLKVTLGSDTSICLGSSIDLTAIGSNGDTSNYEYNWGSGYVSSNTTSVSPSASTTYYVQLKDGCNLSPGLDSITVNVLDPLSISIQAIDTACYGEPVSFIAIPSGGRVSTYSYNWDNGTSTDSVFTKQFFASGSVNLNLSDGCTVPNASTTKTITVRSQLNLQMPSDEEICVGESVDLIAVANGGDVSSYQFIWSPNGGNNAVATVSPTNTTSYNLELTDGCSAPANGSVEVVVNPLPLIDLDADPNPSCIGEEIFFSDLSNAGVGSQYLWTFGDGSFSTDKDPTHIYVLAGKYDISLRVMNENGCIDSLERQQLLEIIERPIADFTYTPDKANFFKPDFMFTNTSSDASSYMWTFGDGGASTSEHIGHFYPDTGTYAVQLIATNELGCADTAVKLVVVEDVVYVYIPNAFTPNNDQRNDEFGIQLRGIPQFSMTVYNRWGEVLFESDGKNDIWDGKYKGELVDEGIYFYIFSGIDLNGQMVERKGNITVLK